MNFLEGFSKTSTLLNSYLDKSELSHFKNRRRRSPSPRQPIKIPEENGHNSNNTRSRRRRLSVDPQMITGELFSDLTAISPKKNSNNGSAHSGKNRRKSISITLPSFMGNKRRQSKYKEELVIESNVPQVLKYIVFLFITLLNSCWLNRLLCR